VVNDGEPMTVGGPQRRRAPVPGVGACLSLSIRFLLVPVLMFQVAAGCALHRPGLRLSEGAAFP